jgi:hypothetical protein
VNKLWQSHVKPRLLADKIEKICKLVQIVLIYFFYHLCRSGSAKLYKISAAENTEFQGRKYEKGTIAVCRYVFSDIIIATVCFG